MTTATTATTTPPPAALLAGADDAQRDARFCALYTRYQRDVLHAAQRMLSGALTREGSLAGISADDLAQEAWLRVWRAWPSLSQQPDALVTLAYAQRCVRRLAIDLLRHRQVLRRYGHLLDMPDDLWQFILSGVETTAPQHAPELVTLAREAQREAWMRARQVLGTSSKQPDLDLTLLAALVEREPLATTAARVGLSIGVVKMRQMRMRALLRPALSPRRPTLATTASARSERSRRREADRERMTRLRARRAAEFTYAHAYDDDAASGKA